MLLNQIKSSTVFSCLFVLSSLFFISYKARAGVPSVPLCTVLDGQTVSHTSKSGPSSAGDTYTFVATNTSGVNRTIMIRYDDDHDTRVYATANSSDGEILAAGATKTYSLTVPADVATTTYMDFSTGENADTTFAVTCSNTPAGAGVTTTKNSTTKEVVASAMRSQVNVIQQNIGSRVSTIGNRAPSPSRGPARSAGGVPVNSGNQNNYSYGSSGSNAIRSLAMMADFDSSYFAGNGFGSVLSLGPGDQCDDAIAQARSGMEGASLVTVWGHGSYSNFDNDYTDGSTDNRYDGDIWGYNIGADYMFSDVLTAGVSLGYSDTDVSTTFNSGTYQEKGWVVSPYAIYSPMQDLTIIAEAGLGWGDIETAKNNNATTASTNSDMWYGAINAAYAIHPVEDRPLSLTSSVAFIVSRKSIDSYTDSDGALVASTHSNTRQVKAMIEAAYDVSMDGFWVVTPFVKTGLIYDFIDAVNGDKAAFSFGGGVRLSDDELGLNAALEGSLMAGRKDYSEYTLSGTVTYGVLLYDEAGKSYGVMKPFLSSNLNEYGHQNFRSGLSFSNDRFSSSLALEHAMSMMDEYEAPDSSRVYLSFSMPF